MKYDSKIRFEDNFEGNYFGSGDLTLSGTFKGTIKIDKLFVSEKASFIGNIEYYRSRNNRRRAN